ncbi:protein of unknown function [Hyphomicrobium sp. 1Nfss2.1]
MARAANNGDDRRRDRVMSEVGGDAAFFPVAVAGGVGAVAATNLGGGLFLVFFACLAASLCLSQGALGSGRQRSLIRVCAHVSKLGLYRD